MAKRRRRSTGESDLWIRRICVDRALLLTEGAPSARSSRERHSGLRRDDPEAEALAQVERDGLRIVVLVADGDVLAGVEEEVAPSHAHDGSSFDPRSPDERAAEDLPQMVEEGVTASLAGLQHARVRVRTERQPVRAVDTGAEEQLDCLRDVPRIALAVLAERNRRVRRRLRDADDARVLPTVENDAVLGRRQSACRLVERAEVDIARAAVDVTQLLELDAERGEELRERKHAPLQRRHSFESRVG